MQSVFTTAHSVIIGQGSKVRSTQYCKKKENLVTNTSGKSVIVN